MSMGDSVGLFSYAHSETASALFRNDRHCKNSLSFALEKAQNKVSWEIGFRGGFDASRSIRHVQNRLHLLFFFSST